MKKLAQNDWLGAQMLQHSISLGWSLIENKLCKACTVVEERVNKHRKKEFWIVTSCMNQIKGQ